MTHEGKYSLDNIAKQKVRQSQSLYLLSIKKHFENTSIYLNSKMRTFFIFLYLAFCMENVFSQLQQSVAARGVLMCGDRPLANTRVKLWDEDDGKWLPYFL